MNQVVPINLDGAWVRRLTQFVLSNYNSRIFLDDLALASGYSKFHFCREFNKKYGVSPMRWLWDLRLDIATELLKQTIWSITDVALCCGFTSSSHLSRTFCTQHSMSPSIFRKLRRLNQSASKHIQMSSIVYDCVIRSLNQNQSKIESKEARCG